jgi:hypothetical protein
MPAWSQRRPSTFQRLRLLRQAGGVKRALKHASVSVGRGAHQRRAGQETSNYTFCIASPGLLSLRYASNAHNMTSFVARHLDAKMQLQLSRGKPLLLRWYHPCRDEIVAVSAGKPVLLHGGLSWVPYPAPHKDRNQKTLQCVCTHQRRRHLGRRCCPVLFSCSVYTHQNHVLRYPLNRRMLGYTLILFREVQLAHPLRDHTMTITKKNGALTLPTLLITG